MIRSETSRRRLVLATNNRHKITEIRAILGDLPMAILTPDDFKDFPDPEETGTTLEANAAIKAKAVARATGCWALADDSGLEIDALDGAPGVWSARFAGPDCSFADNNAKVLRLMADVREERRTARFRCVAALARGNAEIEYFEGAVEGFITPELAGVEGFGYDPIFRVPELGRTFAEASAEEKNRLSHRGIAFRLAANRLRELARAK
jgi:XTP/dITP diphosphohydrolase